jgi:hypothetical protein
MAVEVGAGDVHAVVGQDVVAPVERRGGRGRRARARSPRCRRRCRPPARTLLGVDAALVVQRGGDGLELEQHLGKADAARRRGQRGLRRASRAGSSSTKNTGPAQHHALERRTRGGFGQPLQVQQVAGDDVGTSPRGRRRRRCSARSAASRARSSSSASAGRRAVDIGGDGGAAEGRLGLVGAVEHRGRHGGLAGFELRPASRRRPSPGWAARWRSWTCRSRWRQSRVRAWRGLRRCTAAAGGARILGVRRASGAM